MLRASERRTFGVSARSAIVHADRGAAGSSRSAERDRGHRREHIEHRELPLRKLSVDRREPARSERGRRLVCGGGGGLEGRGVGRGRGRGRGERGVQPLVVVEEVGSEGGGGAGGLEADAGGVAAQAAQDEGPEPQHGGRRQAGSCGGDRAALDVTAAALWRTRPRPSYPPSLVYRIVHPPIM